MNDDSLNGKYRPNQPDLIVAIIVAKFELGRLAITPGVQTQVHPLEAMEGLRRHAQGDWGEVDSEDWKENDFSLQSGLRLLSVYKTMDGVTFWIITEADRSATTILLPDEY